MAGGWEDPSPRWPLQLLSGVLGVPWPLFIHVASPYRAPPHVLGFSEYVDLRGVALFYWWPQGQPRFKVLGTEAPHHDGGVASSHCRRAGGMENGKCCQF